MSQSPDLRTGQFGPPPVAGKPATNVLRAAVGIGVLLAGAGVFYNYVVALPQGTAGSERASCAGGAADCRGATTTSCCCGAGTATT
jgi:hypothetical protein